MPASQVTVELAPAVKLFEGAEDWGEGVKQLLLGVGEVLQPGGAQVAGPPGELAVEVAHVVVVKDADFLGVLWERVGVDVDQALRAGFPQSVGFEEGSALLIVGEFLVDVLLAGWSVLHQDASGLELQHCEVLESVL
jgi:hypothetical protein